MKVLFVASEAAPYAASGGLGDVIGALPSAISSSSADVQTEVILPLYGSMDRSFISKLEKVSDITFSLGWRNTGATIYKIEERSVTYYFIENSYYFDRKMIYGEFDDGERFAFFSMAVIEFILASECVPDIIHANDWQSALSVIYLKTKYRGIEKLQKIKTLYTIHNIEYQGKYDMAILGDVFGLDSTFSDIVEFDGCINLTKGAVVVSDFVSTVSPNYANELEHDYFAYGLSEIIKGSKDKMFGVINGIDSEYFSPETGGDIYFSYTKRAFKSGKAKNKAALQKELGLSVRSDVPLIVMVSRLVSTKGIDLVLHIIEELLAEEIQFVILGTGDEEYENRLIALNDRFENYKAIIKFDRALSKKMYAAADIFVMPSKSEPCGLAQMIACSYGAVPIVRAVGGLYDSIIPYGEINACGFVFQNYNAHELLYTLKWAISVYKDKKEWYDIVKHAIGMDFSWRRSALDYIAIYNKLIGNDG